MDADVQQQQMISALEDAARAIAQLFILIWGDAIDLHSFTAKFPSEIYEEFFDWKNKMGDEKFVEELSRRLEAAAEARDKAVERLEVWMEGQGDLEIPQAPKQTPKYIFTPYQLVFEDDRFEKKEIFTQLTTYFVTTCNFDSVLNPASIRDLHSQAGIIHTSRQESIKRQIDALSQPGKLHQMFRKMRGMDPTMPSPLSKYRDLTEKLIGEGYVPNLANGRLQSQIRTLSERMWTSTYTLYPYAFMLAAQILRVEAAINSSKEPADKEQLPHLEAQLREWSKELQKEVPAKSQLQQCLAASYIRRLINLSNHYIVKLAELQSNSKPAEEQESYRQKYYGRMTEFYDEACEVAKGNVPALRMPEFEQFLEDYFSTLYHDPSVADESYTISFIQNRVSRYVEQRRRVAWSGRFINRKKRPVANPGTFHGGSGHHHSRTDAYDPNHIQLLMAGDYGYYYEDPRAHHLLPGTVHHGHHFSDPGYGMYSGGGDYGGWGHGHHHGSHGGGDFGSWGGGGDYGGSGGGGDSGGGGGGDSGGGGGDSGGGGGF